MIKGYPEAEIKITEEIVQTLINSQFPDLKHLKIRFFNEGWDNKNYRLGTDYIIRIPKRELGSQLLQNEINWLTQNTFCFPLNIPAPIKVGQADQNIPWNWIIVPWFEGQTANNSCLDAIEITKLIEFLKQLHIPNPQNIPSNPYRDVPLAKKSDDLFKRIKNLGTKTNLISPKISVLWQKAVDEDLPEIKYLIHGDLHPFNIIINNGKINAIIDWGDITIGDVATDLACLWMLTNDPETIQKALKQYGVSNSLSSRAIGWAIFYGVTFLEAGQKTNPHYVKMGEFILQSLNS